MEMPETELIGTKRPVWNAGRTVGAKRALKPKQIWEIRFYLNQRRRLRDRALFDLAIDSKLRGCDLVQMKIGDLVSGGQIRTRAIVMQQKTGRPVRFELLPDARASLLAWLERRVGTVDDYVFPSRVDHNGHLSTRQYARFVDEWVTGVGLIRLRHDPEDMAPTQRYEPGMARLLLFNKPFGVLSQFTDRGSQTVRSTLSDFIAVKGVYPAGRLDRDSEGLLLLCDDGRLQARISDPRFKLPKTYLVQVEGYPQELELDRLRQGVRLKDGMTLPSDVCLIDEPDLWPRDPPIRQRRSIPDSWLKITIREGRNRQVRRMTAAVGLPTLRLVRWSIGDWAVAGIAPGQFEEFSTLGEIGGGTYGR